MIVVSDTSPLSNLLIIGRLDLLRSIFGTVLIPSAVAAELKVIESHRRLLLAQDWISTVEISDRQLFDTLRQTLDRGEAEAITLSIELRADFLLIDELAGRIEARDRGIRLIGVAGILVEAKLRGLIDRVKPEIEKLLLEARFHLSPQLVSEVLESVDEK
ncbi:MAG: DUF3368 domain-containing protein [Pyrinomonadaceae bacterium]